MWDYNLPPWHSPQQSQNDNPYMLKLIPTFKVNKFIENKYRYGAFNKLRSKFYCKKLGTRIQLFPAVFHLLISDIIYSYLAKPFPSQQFVLNFCVQEVRECSSWQYYFLNWSACTSIYLLWNVVRDIKGVLLIGFE